MSLNHKHKSDKFADRWREKQARKDRYSPPSAGRLHRHKKSKYTAPVPGISVHDGDYTLTWAGVNTVVASANSQTDVERELRTRIDNINRENQELRLENEALRQSKQENLNFSENEIMWIKMPSHLLDKGIDQWAKIVDERTKTLKLDLKHAPAVMITANEIEIEKLSPEDLKRMNLKWDIDFMSELNAMGEKCL